MLRLTSWGHYLTSVPCSPLQNCCRGNLCVGEPVVQLEPTGMTVSQWGRLGCHRTRSELLASLSKFPVAISSIYGDVCVSILLLSRPLAESPGQRLLWAGLDQAVWGLGGRGQLGGCGRSPLPSPGRVGRADPATKSGLPGRGLPGVSSGRAKPQSRPAQRLAVLLTTTHLSSSGGWGRRSPALGLCSP